MTDTQWSEPFTGSEMKALGEHIRDVLVRFAINGNEVRLARYWALTDDAPYYQLPANHPAVTLALHNRVEKDDMVYWPGGDEAPGDIDRTKQVLRRNGQPVSLYACADYAWRNDDNRFDIIGYHKRTEQPAEVVGEGAEPWPNGWTTKALFARAQVLADEFGVIGGKNLTPLARYIAQREQPPVDPLVGVVEEALAGCTIQTAANLRAELAKRGLQIVPVPA